LPLNFISKYLFTKRSGWPAGGGQGVPLRVPRLWEALRQGLTPQGSHAAAHRFDSLALLKNVAKKSIVNWVRGELLDNIFDMNRFKMSFDYFILDHVA